VEHAKKAIRWAQQDEKVRTDNEILTLMRIKQGNVALHEECKQVEIALESRLALANKAYTTALHTEEKQRSQQAQDDKLLAEYKMGFKDAQNDRACLEVSIFSSYFILDFSASFSVKHVC
jgi:hypothetical protein